jgi:hypothetical protein
MKSTPTIATLASNCPWCGLALTGHVFASFTEGHVASLLHTRRIGDRDYTWTHKPGGCCVPSLNSIMPLKLFRKAQEFAREALA